MNRSSLQKCFLYVPMLLCNLSVAPGADFRPRYEAAILRGAGGESSTPLRIDGDPRRWHGTAGMRFLIHGNAIDVKLDGKPAQSVVSIDDRMLRLLGVSRGVAFFAAEKTKKELEAREFYLPAEVRRLDLAAAAWLPSWALGRAAEPDRNAVVDNARLALVDVLTNEQGVAVVFCDRPLNSMTEIDAYSVAFFEPRGTRAKWTRSFSWRGRGGPTMMVTGGASGASGGGIRALSWLNDEFEPSILLCAGAQGDLVCLSVDRGDIRWRVPRIWEYERGFIGPSTFKHFVERFGILYFDVQLAEQGDVQGDVRRAAQKKAREALADAKRKFEETYSGWITAGPAIAQDELGGHIFIAAARQCGHSEDLGNLAQSIVYELDPESGRVIAASPLPRLVDGRPQHVTPGALIWGCQRGNLVRLHATGHNFDNGFFGPGARWANDATCSVAWYREYSMGLPASWFSASPPLGVAAFDEHFYYRPAASYIESKEQPIFRFVINQVNLETGIDQDVTLSIPYTGDVALPETNYAAVNDTMHSTQPHLLWIGGLSVDDNVLRIFMMRPGSDAADVSLDFKLNR